MIARLLTLLRDKAGAALAELALVIPLFTILIFSVLEMGYAVWQLQQGAIASRQAVRLVSTRGVLTGMGDCGPNTGFAGERCAAVSGSDSWTVTCNGSSGGANCNNTELAVVVNEIRTIYPAAQPNQIVITYEGAGLGFQGLGRPVPIITVEFVGVPFDFIVLDMATIGLAGMIDMPTMRASTVAEDLQNGA